MNSPKPYDQGSIADRERSGLFRNILTAIFGQAGVIAFGLCGMALTTRLLGPEGYRGLRHR